MSLQIDTVKETETETDAQTDKTRNVAYMDGRIIRVTDLYNFL